MIKELLHKIGWHKKYIKFETYKACNVSGCKDCVGFHLICKKCGEELPMNIVVTLGLGICLGVLFSIGQISKEINKNKWKN